MAGERYSDRFMEHFRNPRNAGELEDANGIGEVGSALCGDVVKIFLRIAGGIVEKATFETYGSGGAIASSSAATELVIGKTAERAAALTPHAIVDALDGLPPRKLRSAVIAAKAVRRAVEDYRSGGRRDALAPLDRMPGDRPAERGSEEP